jgi:CDP-diacylglycerol--glycerol-3-phosphate 3-phosphatidyltransferase
VLLALVALAGSFMVSYTRARAEGIGLTASVGLAPRLERLVLIVAGIGLAGLGIGIGLIGAMAIVAILSVATTVQRIWHVHRLSSATPAVASNQTTWEK